MHRFELFYLFFLALKCCPLYYLRFSIVDLSLATSKNDAMYRQFFFYFIHGCVNSVVNPSCVTVTFVLLLNSHFRTSHVFQAPYRTSRDTYTSDQPIKLHVASLFDYALRSSRSPSLFVTVFHRPTVSTHRNDVASDFKLIYEVFYFNNMYIFQHNTSNAFCS